MADGERSSDLAAHGASPLDGGGEALDYRGVFAAAPALILLLANDGPFTILDATDAYLRATRTERESIVGRPLFDVFPDNPAEPNADGVANLRASLLRVRGCGRADMMAVQKYDIRRPDSEGGGFEERYWSPVNAPLRSARGDVRWILHRVEDVTDLVRSRRALERDGEKMRARAAVEASVRRSEEHLRAIIDTTPECVKLVAPDGTLLHMNPSGLAMVEATCVEMVLGQNVYDLIAPEHREAFRAFNERICAGEKGALEFDVVGLNGTRRHMETHAAPLKMPDGTTAQLALTRDITARRRAEAALHEADRRKDDFIATLSHELRNPLAPLRSALGLLRMKGAPDAATERTYDLMERQLGHLIRLVDDLLEASRITRGALELRRSRVELATLVRNAVETSEPLIRGAGHTLTVRLPEEAVWVDADPVRLVQIVANLLNNAARFTEGGGQITITAGARDGDAVISVRDTGRGFSSKSANRLFEMFRRGDRSSGLGIGLALAKRLAEMHGGTIEAQSDGEGRGAEFVVRLPRAAGGGGKTGLMASRPGVKGTRCRVLVADDNTDGAESLADVLRALGAEVLAVYDGEQAVEAARSFRPDIALLDIGMPKLDGYQAARRIRAELAGRPMKIVALTGWGQEEDRRRAREAGFDDHLVKPADLGALEGVLASVSSPESG